MNEEALDRVVAANDVRVNQYASKNGCNWEDAQQAIREQATQDINTYMEGLVRPMSKLPKKDGAVVLAFPKEQSRDPVCIRNDISLCGDWVSTTGMDEYSPDELNEVFSGFIRISDLLPQPKEQTDV